MVSAIIQARVSSSRLPGKVLMPILGSPMLLRMIERVRLSKQVKQIIIATSDDPSDQPIETLCEMNSISIFRGSLNDVLSRFYGAAKKYNADPIVRLTADCPLIDPQIIDHVITKFFENRELSYVSNAYRPSYPDGLDVSVFSMNALELAFKNAKLPSEREHVVPWIWKNSKWIDSPESNAEDRLLFKALNVLAEEDLSKLRWTVDESVDFEFVTKIFEYLYPKNSNFNTNDILVFLKNNPELLNINPHLIRDEGYLKSLKNDPKGDVC